MLGNLMYYCIPLLMDALCMSSEEVVYKSDMQSDEIHPTRMPRNPMQMDVVLSMNTIIPPILEGLKDGIRKLKFDFNAAQTYKEWLSHNSYGGTCRNLQGEVKQAFDWIKGAINMTIGSPQAKTVLMEFHGESLMHFNAIFITKVSGFCLDILRRAEGAPPQPAAVKALCWGLVTTLLQVIFKEVHKVLADAAGLKNIQDDPARVNGLYLYTTLEELQVLWEFHKCKYRHIPSFTTL